MLLALVVSCVVCFRGIALEPGTDDERMWILQGQKLWPLFRDGEWDRPEWDESDSAWGYQNPPVAKYLIGVSLSTHGKRWTWGGGERPPDSVLVAARRPAAVLGVLGALGLFWIGRSALSSPAAVLGSLCLAVSPLWISASRLVMTDIYGAGFAILGMAAFVPVLQELRGRRRGSALCTWTIVSGVLCGLAVGSKMNAVSTPAAIGLVLLALLVREASVGTPTRAGRVGTYVVLGVVFSAACVGTFVFLDPYLHHHPWARFFGRASWFREAFERQAGWAQRHVFEGAFRPGSLTFRLLVAILLFPARMLLLAVLPLVATVVARVQRRTRLPPVRPRLLGWLCLIPLTVFIDTVRNQIVHPWIVWVGLLGSLVALVGSAGKLSTKGGDGLRLVIVWVLVTGFFTWYSTFRPTPRYYLPVLPALCLLAGYGLAALREDLAQSRGRGSTSWFDVAVAFGVLSVLAAFPEYDRASLRAVRTPPGFQVFDLFHGLAVVSLTIAIVTGLWAAAREDRSRTDPSLAPSS